MHRCVTATQACTVPLALRSEPVETERFRVFGSFLTRPGGAEAYTHGEVILAAVSVPIL